MPATKTALIVGASRGLGLGLVTELKSRGWEVVGTVRDDAGARGVEAAGARAERLDTSDAGSVAALSRRLAGETFDLVFAHAGIKGPEHQDPAQATRRRDRRAVYGQLGGAGRHRPRVSRAGARGSTGSSPL